MHTALVSPPQPDLNQPDNDARFQSGLARFRAGDYASAASIFSEVVRADARHVDAWYYLGVAFERLGRLEDALVAWRWCGDFEPARTKLAQHGQPVPRSPETPPPVRPAVPDQPATVAQMVDTGLRDGHVPDGVTPGALLWSGKRRVLSMMTQPSAWTWLVAVAAGVVAAAMVIPQASSGQLALAPTVLVALLGIAADLPSYALRSACTDYRVYEHRIDGREGIFTRREFTVWMYEVMEVTLTRNLWELLTGDATIVLTLGEGKGEIATGKTKAEIRLRGLGDHRNMQQLRTLIRDKSLVERRAMKSSWI